MATNRPFLQIHLLAFSLVATKERRAIHWSFTLRGCILMMMFSFSSSGFWEVISSLHTAQSISRLFGEHVWKDFKTPRWHGKAIYMVMHLHSYQVKSNDKAVGSWFTVTLLPLSCWTRHSVNSCAWNNVWSWKRCLYGNYQNEPLAIHHNQPQREPQGPKGQRRRRRKQKRPISFANIEQATEEEKSKMTIPEKQKKGTGCMQKSQRLSFSFRLNRSSFALFWFSGPMQDSVFVYLCVWCLLSRFIQYLVGDMKTR